MTSSWTVFVIFTNLLPQMKVAAKNDPDGHLQPLGHHRPPIGGVEELKQFPTPWELYETYIKKKGKPFIIRGILNKGDVPAFGLWTDAYLKTNFGTEKVEIEQGKKENRADGELQVSTLSQFLDTYNTTDVYLVHDVPASMKQDLTIPISLHCGGLQNNLHNVVLWFSSGGTKSHLHHDALDNINCLLDGKKDFFLVDKAHGDLIEAHDFNERKSFSNVDVESVDMYKFPTFKDIPWYEVHMKKGDCLFIPYKWYHNVNSKPGRNLAVNLWFYHLQWFNHSDCTHMKANVNEFKAKPMNLFEKASPYGIVWYEILSALDDQLEKITLEDFSGALFPSESDVKTNLQYANEIFTEIDKNKDALLSWEELNSVDTGDLADKFPDLFEELEDSTEEIKEENHAHTEL